MSEGFEVPDVYALLRRAQSALGSNPNLQAEPAAEDRLGKDSELVGSAGGGAVRITFASDEDAPAGVRCAAVHIDPAAIDPEDPSQVEDLVLAAINDAMSGLERPEGFGRTLSTYLGQLGGLDTDLPGLLAGAVPALDTMLAGFAQAFGLNGDPGAAGSPSGGTEGSRPTAAQPEDSEPEPPR